MCVWGGGGDYIYERLYICVNVSVSVCVYVCVCARACARALVRANVTQREEPTVFHGPPTHSRPSR